MFPMFRVRCPTVLTLPASLQVQDVPLPRLGDTLNARVPWYGDAQPAPQVLTRPRRVARNDVDSDLS